MGDSGNEPVLSYVMQTLEYEWTQVKPPDFWTTVQVAKWPEFGPEATEMIAAESQERHFVLLWVDSVGAELFREENSDELSPFVRVWTVYVVKGASGDLQREMAHATATTQALYLGNPERIHPEYTGENDWGLWTRQAPGVPIKWRYPLVAGAYGIGFVWSAWDIAYRHPWPKG